MAFAHLHVHSQFSLLDGTASPGAIARRAADLGMEHVALTDTCNLYGGVAFYKACKSVGVHPVLGAEIAIQPQGIAYADPEREKGGYQTRILVENAVGYGNLCALITKAIFDGIYYRPRIDLELLAAHSEGLIVLTGGRKGAFGRPVLAGQLDVARERLSQLRRILRPAPLSLERP